MTPHIWTGTYRSNSGELRTAEVCSPSRPRSWRIWLAGVRKWLVCEFERCVYYTHYKKSGLTLIGHMQYHRLEQARSKWTTVVEGYYEHESDPPDDILSKLADIETTLRLL